MFSMFWYAYTLFTAINIFSVSTNKKKFFNDLLEHNQFSKYQLFPFMLL